MGLILLFILGALTAAAVFLFGLIHDARFPSRATMGWALGRGFPPDPGAMGLQSTNEIWGRNQSAWRVRGGAPDGVITVIIHGWRRSRIDSLRRLHPWWNVSAEVWLIDLDGHGESPAGPTTLGAADVPAITSFVHDVLASDANQVDRPKRVLFVGHSLGASITLRVAARLPPTSIAGIVAFAPYESLQEPLQNRLKAQALPHFPFAKLAEICLHMFCGNESSTTAALRSLHSTGVPVLLIAAQSDPVVSLKHVQRMANSAGVTVTIDASAGHDDLGTKIDIAPESTTSQAAQSFLKSLRVAIE